MPGKVTVFNCYNEPAQLFVSGSGVGMIAAWAPSGNTMYTPAAITVPRALNPSPGAFVSGPNNVQIQWDSSMGSTIITVPSNQVSLDDDLLLFITINEAFLVSAHGYTLATFQVQSGGGPF